VTTQKVKAIGLLSGGLDSTLATRIMEKLGFDIVALNFMSPFCTCTNQGHGCRNEAKRLADELGIPARVEFMGAEYLKIVQNPKHGYGSGMNPCIDCRILTFKRAKEIMIEEGAAFVFTGEVIGQRPMSQQRDRMTMIEKEAGLVGMIVRPLCAKLMEPSIPEQTGIVDREKMLDIHGRSRKEQIKIAKEEFGMTENLCSSGGCLLTDPQFAHKMRDLVDHLAVPTVKDARFLRLGRHFRVTDDAKLIVGRNHEENQKIERMAASDEFLFYPAVVNGPLALLKGTLSREAVEIAASITARYCKSEEGADVLISYRTKESNAPFTVTATVVDEKALETARI
jgi:tRNA U34 2-thiouridine synthase MnmA/TrmU